MRFNPARTFSVAVCALLAATAMAQSPSPCLGDLDRDGVVDSEDVSTLIASWGTCEVCDAELTGDGRVDGLDLLILFQSWGDCLVFDHDPSRPQVQADGTIVFGGTKYRSLSDFIQKTDRMIGRCGTRPALPFDDHAGRRLLGGGGIAGVPGDCDWNVTKPLEDSLSVTFCIPVVVHVLRDDGGVNGHIPVATIVSQIEVLNQRFADSRIRFELATTDPSGAPTLGIRYHDNTVWYLGGGDPWATLAWDTSEYLNIYTLGLTDLGWATFPWQFPPGDPRHRVLVRSSVFGVGGPNPSYDQGLTCVHEIGHYLGLYHTHERLVDLDGDGAADEFSGHGVCSGCCYGNGDLCCDTNRETQAHGGCNQGNTCDDGPDPAQNYMSYSDDACMTEFTRDQIWRMRCVLRSWRATLGGPCSIPGDLNGDGTVNGGDIAVVLALWGECSPGVPCLADLNNDGVVNAADLSVLLVSWPSSSPLPRTVPAWATLIEAEPNPAVVTDELLHIAILDTGLAWHVRDNGTGIEMLLIPPGTFDMGCSESNLWTCEGDENPVHPVTLTCPVYVGRCEVTQAQWQAIMGSNPSYWVARLENGYSADTNRPVEQVSWNMIQGFLSATGMRLPTEAEWEYAYRAGTTTAYHGWAAEPAGTNDDMLAGNIAWFLGNNGPFGTPTYGTKTVGQKRANGFGLHDMSGNVWEWVNDWHGSDYYASSPSTNPAGPAFGPWRVLRGGSWSSYWSEVRSSQRAASTPGDVVIGGGFRVARDP